MTWARSMEQERADLRTPLHASLVRPVLLGGGEREPVVINAVMVAALVLGMGPHPLTLGLAALLATLGHTALVLAARSDPQMWRVYTRHLQYARFYPARAVWWARQRIVLPFRGVV